MASFLRRLVQLTESSEDSRTFLGVDVEEFRPHLEAAFPLSSSSMALAQFMARLAHFSLSA